MLSIVSKVFTAILNKRLYAWAENEEKISKEQVGFRKGYSTIDHIFTLITMVKSKYFFGTVRWGANISDFFACPPGCETRVSA